MATTSNNVNVRQDYGLYQLLSSSSTVYYVRVGEFACDVLRARGDGHTMIGRHDNEWLEVQRVLCGPILWRAGDELGREDVDEDDVVIDVLRVGSRHRFEYRVPGDDPESGEFWMTGRVCERIEQLDHMPPEGERTIQERVPRPDGV